MTQSSVDFWVISRFVAFPGDQLKSSLNEFIILPFTF